MVYVRAGRGIDVVVLMWCGVAVAEWLSSAVVLKRGYASCYAPFEIRLSSRPAGPSIIPPH